MTNVTRLIWVALEAEQIAIMYHPWRLSQQIIHIWGDMFSFVVFSWIVISTLKSRFSKASHLGSPLCAICISLPHPPYCTSCCTNLKEKPARDQKVMETIKSLGISHIFRATVAEDKFSEGVSVLNLADQTLESFYCKLWWDQENISSSPIGKCE